MIKNVAKEETRHKVQALMKLEALHSELSAAKSTTSQTAENNSRLSTSSEAYWQRQA